MKTVLLFSIAILLAGCKKPADRPVLAHDTDRVEVLARHRAVAGKEDLAADPVIVHFDRFTVTKAKFDPAHLEGGTATIELDMTSIKTGNTERDSDLQSPDYIDIGKFATAIVEVTNVVHRDAATYSAQVSVAFRGATVSYPVTFAVLATSATAVRIKGEYTFSRLDFGVGIDPAKDPTERIDTPLVIQWVLTLEPT